MRGTKKIWIEYDKDGLPIRVTDTAQEMAEQSGASINSIRSGATHGKHRDKVRFRYVEVEDE